MLFIKNFKKKISIFLIALFLACNLNAQCVNGDLEDATFSFTGWKLYTGSNLTGAIELGKLIPGYAANYHTIVSSAPTPLDPYGGFKKVIDGNYALRLGSEFTGSRVQVASYTINVNSSNANFSFSYALVLEDPGHKLIEQPFFEYWISTTDNISISKIGGT